jgi:hypothetical protein
MSSEQTKAKPGDDIVYVSPFRTGTFPARITSVHPDGTVDIDTWIPGMTEGRQRESTLHLRKLKFGPNERARHVD